MSISSAGKRAIVFIAIGVTAAIALILALHPPGPSMKPYRIETDLPVTGLKKQAFVYFRGVPVGIIDEIGFVNDGFPTVRIDFSVDENLPLTSGTFAQLSSAGITSGILLELDVANESSEILETSARSPALVPLKPQFLTLIEDQLASMAQHADAVLVNLAKLSNEDVQQQLTGLFDDAHEVLLNIKAVTSDLPGMQRDLSSSLMAVSDAAAKLAALSSALEERTIALPDFLATGVSVEARLVNETLPALEATLEEIEAASTALAELAELLSDDPQAIFSGRPIPSLGPGETEEKN